MMTRLLLAWRGSRKSVRLRCKGKGQQIQPPYLDSISNDVLEAFQSLLVCIEVAGNLKCGSRFKVHSSESKTLLSKALPSRQVKWWW